MFNELTIKEQFEVEGGAIPVFIKVGLLVAEIIFLAGTLKGCTDEAAK